MIFTKSATSLVFLLGAFHLIFVSSLPSSFVLRSELIFSDSLYPINQFLLDTIKPEVQQNVRRINRHPSNAQWAGGNEVCNSSLALRLMG